MSIYNQLNILYLGKKRLPDYLKKVFLKLSLLKTF